MNVDLDNLKPTTLAAIYVDVVDQLHCLYGEYIKAEKPVPGIVGCGRDLFRTMRELGQYATDSVGEKAWKQYWSQAADRLGWTGWNDFTDTEFAAIQHAFGRIEEGGKVVYL